MRNNKERIFYDRSYGIYARAVDSNYSGNEIFVSYLNFMVSGQIDRIKAKES